jgi:CRISPR-associated protein (TIGR03986 family)
MTNSKYTLPTHLDMVPDSRAALAPYNFVPLPEQVVPAEPRPTHDAYHKDRHTGRIACTITTASPLYVRCGYTPEEYAALSEKSFDQMTEEERHKRAQFFNLGDPNTPMIPGSSLRGMLRALVEIASYGKMEKVTDVPRFFYRAVAAQKADPLAAPYKGQLRNVRAGYVARRGSQWFIRQARAINNETFIKVREQDIPITLGLVRLNSPNYHIQTMEVSFTTRHLKPSPRSPQGRTVVDLIDKPGIHPESGWLVTSGNMIETGQQGQRSPRKSHAVVLSSGDQEWKIADAAVEDYRNGLSDYQIEQLGPQGVLVEGRPVFYCEPPRGEREVVYFGHSPNFRLPYRFPGSNRAATPLDFVPESLRSEVVIDVAEAIFGVVRRKKQSQDAIQAIAGRIFVGDARLTEGQDDPFVSAAPLTTQILGSPKPTTFQHYLVQPNDDQATLKHYASRPGEETVVRGHKLYWHKGENPDFALPTDQRDINESQKTSIRPIKPGVHFTFEISFENLSDVELGALLWVLEKAANDDYRLKLGMGKPLGLGAVKIESQVYVSKRDRRYATLFAGDTWASGEEEFQRQQDCLEAFHRHVLEHSGEPNSYQEIDKTLRIRCLLALLRWHGPNAADTRYLEIERAADTRGGKVNEYKNRPVLPSPLQVIGETAQAPGQAALRRDEQQASTAKQTLKQTSSRSDEPQLPAVGTVITGLVLERDEKLVIIEVPGFSREQAVAVLKVEANTPQWAVGKDKARVEVLLQRQRGDLAILNVKRATKEEKR